MRSPSFAQVAALKQQTYRSIPFTGGNYEPVKRRREQKFADEMRRRGWLSEEGYAPKKK